MQQNRGALTASFLLFSNLRQHVFGTSILAQMASDDVLESADVAVSANEITGKRESWRRPTKIRHFWSNVCDSRGGMSLRTPTEQSAYP